MALRLTVTETSRGGLGLMVNNTAGARRQRSASRWRSWGIALCAALTLGFLVAPPSSPAGPPVVPVVTTITHANGNPITPYNSQAATSYLNNVPYGCNVADCPGVKVVIAAPDLDPTYNT